MIYLKKCDEWDRVYDRYDESYMRTLDSIKYMPESDIDYFCHFLRKNMRDDLKQSVKDAKKLVKQWKKADRKARRKAWRKAVWAKITGVFKRGRKSVSAPITANTPPEPAEPTENLPQTVSDNSPATTETQTHE